MLVVLLVVRTCIGRLFTVEEVSRHDTKEDLWVIIDSKVYDLSGYKNHPGGTAVISKYAGQDATSPFYANHGKRSRDILRDEGKKYKIGHLKIYGN